MTGIMIFSDKLIRVQFCKIDMITLNSTRATILKKSSEVSQTKS